MNTHLDLTKAAYREAAAEILLRHDSDNAEANITSAIRNFLTQTGLAKAEEIVEENPPSDGSRRAVDLTALDTFIEVKRRIGANAGFDPDPANVQQLDDYLELSKSDGKGIRTGILTDGKYWLLRWPEAGPVRTSRPYGFVLESSDQWNLLREWLRDSALISLESIPADRSSVEQYLGPGSPTYQRDIDVLASLYGQAAQSETVRVKRRLWENLLRAALGEIARDPAELTTCSSGTPTSASSSAWPSRPPSASTCASWPKPIPPTCSRAAASATPPGSAASSSRTSSPGPTRWAATTS